MNENVVGIGVVVIIALEVLFWVFVGTAISKWMRSKYQP